MKVRFLCCLIGIAALALLAQAQAPPTPAAKTKAAANTWTVPRTGDGKPDFSGFWSNNNATPLERPKELAGRATLTEQELAAMKKKAHDLFGGKSDAAFGDSVFTATLANVQGKRDGFKSTDGEVGDYSSVWTVERDWDNRTSLITDPPDGRIPAMTPEAQAKRQASLASMARLPEGPEDRLLQERCITYGTPQLTEGYQSQYQIVQSATSIAVMTEMIHDARVIPVNSGPHPPAAVQQWRGDSRGHWEGDTLVVDTSNYKPRAFMSISSGKLHVTERFTRTGPEMLRYEITIDDPDVWTKPWSLMIPLRRSSLPVYEYACHEGNEGLAGILAGARAQEAAAAKAR
jgi:hypothetical protein